MTEFPSLQSSGPSSLQLPESLSSFRNDAEPSFVNQSDTDRFRCPVHGGLLVDPQQTTCGHRLCSRCIVTHLDGATSKRCPVGEADCEEISRDEVLRDNSIMRDILNALVYCKNRGEGCLETLRYRNMKVHLLECQYETVPCMHTDRGCQEKVQRKNIPKHQPQCPFRPVPCHLCQVEVNYRQMKDHEKEECPEKVTGCPYECGNKTLKRKEIDEHKRSCPVQPVDCKFKEMGCTYTNKRELVTRHEKEDLDKHLELVTKKIAELELRSLDTQQHLQALRNEGETLQGSLQSTRRQDQGPQAAIKALELKVVQLVQKIIIAEQKISELLQRPRVETMEQNLAEIRQRISQLEQMQDRERQQRQEQQQQRTTGGSGSGGRSASSLGPVGRFSSLDDMANTLSAQLRAHDTQLCTQDIRLAEMDLRFQLLETASYDGTLVWKIRDYDRRKRDAMNGRTLSLYSQPFYTGRFGYKLCARVYLNGDGMGKGTHLSLFFVVMRGEYDALLHWPFRQKVTLKLLDQSPEKRHLSDHFQPDSNSSSFQKPTSEMNVASGCPLFVSHAVLENRDNGYLKDDTIFIRIVVDADPNPACF